MFVNLIIKINLILRRDNIHDKNKNYKSENERKYENQNDNDNENDNGNDNEKKSRTSVVIYLCNKNILDTQ